MSQPATEGRKAASRKYYLKNKAKILKANENWWKAHPEKLRAKWNRRKFTRSAQQLERAKVTRKEWRQSNRERVAANKRKWQVQNRERLAVYLKDYGEKNKEHLKDYRKKYWDANRALSAAHTQKRRALEKQAAGNLDLILQFFHSVKSKPSAICYYCQKRTPTKAIHFDHIVPLAKGGQHSVENLCVACAKCNLTKYNRTPAAWTRIGQQVLAL